jgi:hypothetical protein
MRDRTSVTFNMRLRPPALDRSYSSRNQPRLRSAPGPSQP